MADIETLIKRATSMAPNIKRRVVYYYDAPKPVRRGAKPLPKTSA